MGIWRKRPRRIQRTFARAATAIVGECTLLPAGQLWLLKERTTKAQRSFIVFLCAFVVLKNFMDYNTDELMVCQAARQLRDGEVVFVGIGLPNLACNLARLRHAPNLVLIYESGAVGAAPDRLPISIGDPALVTN